VAGFQLISQIERRVVYAISHSVSTDDDVATHVRKTAKSGYELHVCPYPAPHSTDFHEIRFLGGHFPKICREKKNQVSSKSDNNNGYFT
jgi:hypothetical protein